MERSDEGIEAIGSNTQKNNNSPQEHLQHLLNIGWAPNSPLIRKYVAKKHLQQELKDYVSLRQATV